MPEQELAFDSVRSPDLTVGKCLSLLDLAHLELSQRPIEALIPRLARRLHQIANFDVVTLGVYDPSVESIRLSACKVGDVERRHECLPVHACVSGSVWKNQRSLLVQDLSIEAKLPVFLESLRRLGVRTYYVFPLTTNRHKLGAIGFGSLNVIPKTAAIIEFLRRAAAIVAQLLDTTPAPDGPIATADCAQAPPAAAPRPEPGHRDFDLRDYAKRRRRVPGDGRGVARLYKKCCAR
jgi:transcriptional regulator with GAF, ATPase, and Fis domain